MMKLGQKSNWVQVLEKRGRWGDFLFPFNDEQIQQIAEFIELIKFRSRFQKNITDVNQFANLYQEFVQEDRELAEAGMTDYVSQLQQVAGVPVVYK